MGLGSYGRRLRVPTGMLAAICAVSVPDVAKSDDLPSCIGPSFERVEVSGATDGVTLKLSDGREVRLRGVIAPGVLDDAPEARTRATEFLHALVAGKRISLHGEKDKRDRYGRLIARAVIEQDKRWIDSALIQSGFARVFPVIGDSCMADLLKQEQSARNAHAGLWAHAKFTVFDAANIQGLTQAVGRFAVVEGRINRVGDTKARVYLDFGRRFIEDFSIVIPRSLRAGMIEKGGEPKNWRGKRVRVRGVLVSWGGPAIQIYDISAIELLDHEN